MTILVAVRMMLGVPVVMAIGVAVAPVAGRGRRAVVRRLVMRAGMVRRPVMRPRRGTGGRRDQREHEQRGGRADEAGEHGGLRERAPPS